jgi:hypothetical protein
LSGVIGEVYQGIWYCCRGRESEPAVIDGST